MVSRIRTQHRVDTPELLDQPAQVLGDLPANLRDIRRLNRWFGGTSLVVRRMDELLADTGEARVLDVATGSADIPLALLHRSRSRGQALEVVGLDVSDQILTEARVTLGKHPVRLVQGDARDLPFPNDAFDVSVCSLALHHFEPDDAVRVIREMWRVSARAILITDLVRTTTAWAGTWIATRTVARNRVTQHDGPLSVLRAYTTQEMRELAREAGLVSSSLRRSFPFRQSLTAWKSPPAHGS